MAGENGTETGVEVTFPSCRPERLVGVRRVTSVISLGHDSARQGGFREEIVN